MKHWFACAVLLAMFLGCKKENDPAEIVTPEPVLKKEEVMARMPRNIHHIAEWNSVSGKDTTFTFVLKQMWPYADGNGPKQVKYFVF